MMKIRDIWNPGALSEQAFKRNEVLSELVSYSYNVNTHVILIIAFQPSQWHNHWKAEVKGWLNALADIKLKQKGNPPIPSVLYLKGMWERPFVPHEVMSMTEHLEDLAREKTEVVRNQKTVDDLITQLHEFHQIIAQSIASKNKQYINLYVDALS